MCLTVKRSFVKNPIPSAYCWKVIERIDDGSWLTPFQETKIPKTGILIPRTKSKRKHEFHIGANVYGSYIHACTTLNRAKIIHMEENFFSYGLKIFKAIATDIVAIGYDNDLICKALYIPELDLTIKS